MGGVVPVDGRGEGRVVHTVESVLLEGAGVERGERRVHSGGVLQGGRDDREGGAGADGFGGQGRMRPCVRCRRPLVAMRSAVRGCRKWYSFCLFAKRDIY